MGREWRVHPLEELEQLPGLILKKPPGLDRGELERNEIRAGMRGKMTTH